MRTTVTVELHHQGGVRYDGKVQVQMSISAMRGHDKQHWRTGRGDASSGEIDHGEPLQPCGLLEEVERRLDVLGVCVEFLLAHHARLADLTHHCALVAHGLDDVARARLALGTDERGAFGDTAEGLAQVARTADEGHFECVLVNVVLLVCGSEHLGLVNVVDSDRLKNLYFCSTESVDQNNWADAIKGST